MKLKHQRRETKVIPLNPIRIERELSKFPVHQLAKRGSLNVDIRGRDRKGREFRWMVAPNRVYGEPKELAYRIDTLIVNRRIEEAGKVKPKVIKLGSLRGICRELGLNEGKAVKNVKNALRQNAHTGITAKITYQSQDGTERSIEGDFNRYSVIFTGEKLSDGRKADAVYVILNDVYREVLNNAGTRPLDYDYLKILPPSSQRFYELVSPQIFAAIKYKLPFARYTYSDFCMYSALTCYTDATKVKKQLYKITLPHKKSGYLESISYQNTTDEQGRPDWLLHLVPGSKAFAEFRQFALKQDSSKLPSLEIASPKEQSLEVLPSDEGTEDSDAQELFQQSFLHDLLKSIG
ncbi:MAG: hypothetical protein F6K31_35665 [Symploca sp. SIO2G7]|nr:hypothetical protein [Symploca sp. SIO2G7]